MKHIVYKYSGEFKESSYPYKPMRVSLLKGNCFIDLRNMFI